MQELLCNRKSHLILTIQMNILDELLPPQRQVRLVLKQPVSLARPEKEKLFKIIQIIIHHSESLFRMIKRKSKY